MNRKGTVASTLGMLALLLAIGLAGHYASPLLPRHDVEALADPGCDLRRQPCWAALPDGARLQLSITPRPIPVLAPLAVEALVEGMEVERAEIDFAGEAMNMGFNRTPLERRPDGRYAAVASLPVCISGGMTWVATVLLESGRRRIAVRFRFSVTG